VLGLLQGHLNSFKDTAESEIDPEKDEMELVNKTEGKLQEEREAAFEKEQDDMIDNTAPSILVKLMSKSAGFELSAEAMKVSVG
jgi:hypothetical protein